MSTGSLILRIMAATYRQIGGDLLSSREIQRTIAALFYSMLVDYEDPNCYDSFPFGFQLSEGVT